MLPGILAEIDKGRFVKTVEIDPPKGADLKQVLEGAQMLKQGGIDAINIADSPMARVRMSPVAIAHLVKEKVGIDSILHFTCRDRNLLGLQSELLGAAALGISNVLALTGDPPSIGDHPQATAVFDVNSEGLVRIISGLNRGQDMMGNQLATATNFAIGVAVNPAAEDLPKEIERLKNKIQAGAHFAQTQPIYDLELLERFLAAIDGIEIPILVGVFPCAAPDTQNSSTTKCLASSSLKRSGGRCSRVTAKNRQKPALPSPGSLSATLKTE